jgi:hypothetical protein
MANSSFIVRAVLVVVAVAVAGAAVYGYFAVSSPRKPPERFALIADLPLNSRGSVPSAGSPGTHQAVHDQIQTAIRQRLLVAYRTLAYANSGKWSLATWAQLQWVRDALDGEGLEDMQTGMSVDASLGDFSFVRLLHELVETAAPDQKQAAEDARRDGMGIIEELAAVTPNTRKPIETLKGVVSKIETAPGLQPFVSGFPRFSDIPPPPDDD